MDFLTGYELHNRLTADSPIVQSLKLRESKILGFP